LALGRPLLGGDRRAKSESREGGTARKVARGSPQPPLSHVWRTRTAEAIAGAGSRRMDSFFSHRSFVCHGLNWGKKARAACLRNPGILDSSKGRQLPARFPRFRVARLVCSLSTTNDNSIATCWFILRNQRTYTPPRTGTVSPPPFLPERTAGRGGSPLVTGRQRRRSVRASEVE